MIRQLLRDPVYKSGITSHSVDNMFFDIVQAVSGATDYISVPEPMTGSCPMMYISLNDNLPIRPMPLNIGTIHAVSRRSQNYNLRHGPMSVPTPLSISRPSSEFGDDDLFVEDCAEEDIDEVIGIVQSQVKTIDKHVLIHKTDDLSDNNTTDELPKSSVIENANLSASRRRRRVDNP